MLLDQLQKAVPLKKGKEDYDSDTSGSHSSSSCSDNEHHHEHSVKQRRVDKTQIDILALTRKALLLKDKDTTIETDYIIGQKVQIQSDGYNLVMAANLVGSTSPLVRNNAIKKAYMIFCVQIFFSFLYFWDFRELDNFQPIDLRLTSVRIIFALLLQKQVIKELQ